MRERELPELHLCQAERSGQHGLDRHAVREDGDARSARVGDEGFEGRNDGTAEDIRTDTEEARRRCNELVPALGLVGTDRLRRTVARRVAVDLGRPLDDVNGKSALPCQWRRRVERALLPTGDDAIDALTPEPMPV